MATATHDIIIVGAGIAGLSAALDLLRLSTPDSVSSNATALPGGIGDHSAKLRPRIRVIILEARDRVGGRIHTDGDGNDNAIDLGASFVHGTHDNPLTELGKEVPFSLYLPTAASSSRYLSHNAKGQSLSAQKADRMDYITFSAVFSRLRNLAQEHPDLLIDQSVSMQEALVSAEDVYRKALWSKEAGEEDIDADTVEAARELMSVWAGWTGAPLDEVALKWWGFEKEYEGEDAVVKEGYGPTLIEWYRREVCAHGGEILLNTEVTSICDSDEDDGIAVTSRDSISGQERTLSAGRMICTLPLGVLQYHIKEESKSLFQPPLPARRLDALRRLGNGLLNKVVLRYQTAWWRDPTLTDEQRNPQLMLCPSSIKVSSDGSLKRDSTSPAPQSSALDQLRHGPFFIYDYDVVKSQPTLTAFIAPPLAEALESEADEEIAEVLHRRLVDYVCAQTTPEPPRGVIVTRWRHDPFSRGSYTFLRNSDQENGTPGSTPLDFDELARPLWDGRLGFAGEHCHADCYASVHGALLSGRREAARIWSEIRRTST
ncbi:unnamed protein product [Tilletia controversa]|uniref:Amine oxidase domain-containing protein n=2 Tax=Tilletia TaxID=13289 RepID=A0A8X7MWP7_9BASI|nr:hypothetical protein CF336_g3913 [Tilletia laevis]KAE8201295.1 hypothetical protein CF328_g2710 [Tilletia controversa]KAE8261448.1 hypothetical protein A4X03_0g3241 [Tilletia caries]KAE8203249.1 hypothetical protein CF335_g3104 [Tilletia laevis]KAE8250090.1 hypothetical protein A4X06_0g2927 [Tilletia controversa]